MNSEFKILYSWIAASGQCPKMEGVVLIATQSLPIIQIEVLPP